MSDYTFARKASGLARPVSPWDVLFISFQVTAIGYIAMNLSYGYAIYPGGDFTVAGILGGVLTICGVLSYALCATVLPRSGADYIFVSRVLHPALGTAAAINNMVFTGFFAGWNGVFFARFGIPLVLGELWVATGNTSYLDSIAWISGNAAFVGLLGGIAFVIFYAAILLPAFKVYVQFAKIWFFICLIGAVLCIIVLAFTTPSTFSSMLEKIAGAGVVEQTIADGKALGSIQPFSWDATLGVIPLIFAGCGFVEMGVYVAGEYKNVKRSTLLAIPAAVVLAVALLIGWHVVSLYAVGKDFLYSSNMLYNFAPDKYQLQVPPIVFLFAGIAGGNTAIALFLGISFLSAFIVPGPWNVIISSRYAFAMAMDRILPSRLTATNRWGSPHYAVAAFVIVAFIWVLGLTYTTVATYLGLTGILGLSFAYFLTQVSAMLMPYRLKSAFEGSPVKWRVAGIPVMSIVGAIGTVFLAWLSYVYLVNPLYGSNSLQALSLVVGFPIFSVIFYFVVRAYRKSQGIDIDLLYKEIPPI